jgi:sugar phosphate isomerase/epimerase
MFRRSLQIAAFAAAGSLTPLWASAASRSFKIGACDWSLGKRGDPAALDVAKQIGLDGVQIVMGDPANEMQLRKAAMQKAYAEAAKRTGVEIASVAIDAIWHAPLKSDPRAAQWTEESIEICRAMHLPISMVVCFDLDLAKPGDFDRFVSVMRGIVPKAEKQGVVLGLENWLSAEDNLRIIDRVGSPALKVYYDVGNSTDKGRDILKEIRTLGSKHLCEIHFKDGKFALGQGRIDFKAVRKALDDIEYSGWIHLEAAAPHGVIADYTAYRKYLRGIFPRQV